MLSKINNFIDKHPYIFRIITAVLAGFLTILLAESVANIIYDLVPTWQFTNDQAMFYYMGKQLALGKTPYIDFYDHKGLYLFYYLALGYLMGGKIGVFFIQVINLSIFFYVYLLICKVINFSTRKTLIAVLLFVGLYGTFHQSPSDFEVQMVLVAFSLYFYIRGIKEDSEKMFLIGNVFTGLSAGLDINVRASDAMVPLSLVIFYLIYEIRKKKVANIFINAGVCVFSLLLMCVPPFIHSYVGGFTEEMYDAIIFSNFKYVSSVGSSSSFSMQTILMRLVVVLFSVGMVLLVFFKRKEISKEEALFHYVSIGVVGFIQFVIAMFPHYFITCFPYLCLFFLRIISLYKHGDKVEKGLGFAGVFLVIFSSIFYPVDYYAFERNNALAVKEFIDATISEEDKQNTTLCYTCSTGLYLNSNMVSCLPDFAAQTNHGAIKKEFSDEVLIPYFKKGDVQYIIVKENHETGIYKWLKGYGQLYFEKVDDSSFKGGQYIDIYHYITYL